MRFIKFLQWLIDDVQQKVFLIVVNCELTTPR